MVRKGDWKLTWDMEGTGALYNLATDPVEMVNLFGQPAHGAIQHELMAELLTWLLRTQDPLPLPRKRYVQKRQQHNYWATGEV